VRDGIKELRRAGDKGKDGMVEERMDS